jgi:biotin transport system substrate-specific component
MSQAVADRSTGPIATAGVSNGRQVLASDAALVVGASLLMAICAHVSIPLWFTPVPITLQTFGVILLALTLGGWRASAALALYLAEGMVGLPVFSPHGAGGMAQIFGPTGGYLMAYPFAALAAGLLAQKLTPRGRIAALTVGALAAEIVIFGAGVLWLMFILRTSLTLAYHGGVLPFLPGEVLKVAAAVGIAFKLKRFIA